MQRLLVALTRLVLKLKRQGTRKYVSQKDLVIENDKETSLFVAIIDATSVTFFLFHPISSHPILNLDNFHFTHSWSVIFASISPLLSNSIQHLPSPK